MSALASGLSGLIANQRKLDVVGNNLANLNTTAFKTRRTSFADLLYQTITPAAGESTATSGLGAVQAGSGVRVSTVDVTFSQGALQETGADFDMAIDGAGFFVLNGASENLYTRDGGFLLDSNGILVDGGSGFSVQRLGALGEPGVSDVGFQVAGDPRIRVPFGAQVPGTATDFMSFAGNLDADALNPEARVLQSANVMESGGLPASATTLLNDLDTSIADYVAGDFLELTGTDADGSPVTRSIAVDGTTTVGDLIDEMNSVLNGAVASLEATGEVRVTANETGESLLSLDLEDNPANTGSLNTDAHALLIAAEGREGEIVESSVQIFDNSGTAYIVRLNYQKVGENEWDLNAELDPDAGTVIDGSITGIRFNENGAFQQVDTLGIGDASFTFQFAGQAVAQDITIDLGTANQFDGLTQVASRSTLRADQNGFPAGSLNQATISTDGIIEGIATNGRRVQLAQLAMATFNNQNALDVRSGNQFSESNASGSPNIGSATTGGRGLIRVGQLEASNVDVALEFTQLILAQRGFSASARTITVADEMLQELNGIIR